MADLFPSNAKKNQTYDANDIEVLEGLEPVRRRPGMYIGGTDEAAMHHLAAEVLDNGMDEAVAGYANRITLHLGVDKRRGAHPLFDGPAWHFPVARGQCAFDP